MPVADSRSGLDVSSSSNDEIEKLGPAEEPEEMPLPSDTKVIFLGGLFTLALLAALYEASEIVWPLVFAIILQLLLLPIVRILERLYVPRLLAALLLIFILLGTATGLGTAISGPAATWAATLPTAIPRLQERLSFLETPINTLLHFAQQVENFAGTRVSPDAAATTLLTKLFSGTRSFTSGFFTTLLFLFFEVDGSEIEKIPGPPRTPARTNVRSTQAYSGLQCSRISANFVHRSCRGRPCVVPIGA